MRREPFLRSLLLGVALLAGLAAGGGASAEPPPPAPKAPGTPPPAKVDEAVRAGVLAAVDEIREEVARVRGLAWKKKVPAEMLSREELLANLEQMIQEEHDEAEYAKDLKILRRVGMLSETDDPLAMMKRYFGAGIQGYYDPEKKNFFMVDGLSIEGQRPVIFHELTHALDDQYIDIDALTEALKKDEDRNFAFKCTIEGCAEYARVLYEGEHPEVAEAYEKGEREQAQKQVEAIKDMPAFLLLPSQLHYTLGLAFVKRAVGDDFGAAMARLYADMPVSQEQILHPDRYLSPSRDLPQKLAWSPGLAASGGEGCKVFDEDTMGELDLALWLDFHLGTSGGKLDIEGIVEGRLIAAQAKRASVGWDGTRIAFLEKPGLPLTFLVASAWDTEKDAREAGEAMVLALERQYRAKERWSLAEKDGVLRAEWKGPNGPGRAEVEGTRVFLVDGFPAEGLDAVFAEVRKTTFQRDPKDTWDPAKPLDPFRDALWSDAERGLAWRPLGKGWTVSKDEKDPAVAWLQPAGGPRIKVASKRTSLEGVLIGHVVGIRSRLPKGFDLMQAISDTTVADKPAGRLVWTEKAAGGDVRHETLFVKLARGTLVVDAEAPEAEAPAMRKALAQALEGFYAPEE
jgi:hypothetical protein